MALTIEALGAMLLDMQKNQKVERDSENKIMKTSILNSIKSEVSEQIVISLQPMESRQNKLESELLELKSAIASIQSTTTPSFSSVVANQTTKALAGTTNQSTNQTSEPEVSRQLQLRELINIGKCSLSFFPISNESLNLIVQTNPDENKWNLAVKHFLVKELKMPESFVTNLKIVEAWPSNNVQNVTDSWTKIHAKFEYPYIVSKIFGFVKNLERGRRVSMFVPKPILPRYRAMEEIAFDLRHTHHKKTLIKYSMTDLVLYTRGNAQEKWVIHQTSQHVHLPPIELSEPSVFVDVGNINDEATQANNNKMTNLPNFGPKYNTFPCSQITSNPIQGNNNILLNENITETIEPVTI